MPVRRVPADRDDRVLPAKTLAEMRTPAAPPGDDAWASGYGLGLQLFHPDTPLQGIEFVCPWTTLGTPAAQQEISSAVFALVPGLTSNTVGTAVAAVSDLIGLAFEKPLAAEPLFRTLGFNLVVPPNVRADLLDRTLDNNDVLAQLQVPVLVTQGAKDRILAPEASRQLAERIPGATLSVYPGAGHAPFVDNPGRFNRELRHFVLDG